MVNRNLSKGIIMEEPTERLSLRKDLALSVLRLGVGLVFGVAESAVHPYALPNSVKHIDDRGIKNINEISSLLGEVIGYAVGLGGFVVLPIVNHPERPESYIFAVANLVSGVGQFAYKKGRKSGLEQAMDIVKRA